MKIVFLDAATLGDTSLEPIAKLGDLVCWPTSTPEEARARVGDCEVLIINKIKAAWFTKNYAVSVAGTMPSRFLDGLCV